MSLEATALNSAVQKISLKLHSEGWGETNNEQIRKIHNDECCTGKKMEGKRWSWVSGQETSWRMWYFSCDLNDRRNKPGRGDWAVGRGAMFEGDKKTSVAGAWCVAGERLLWDVAQGFCRTRASAGHIRPGWSSSDFIPCGFRARGGLLGRKLCNENPTWVLCG